MSVLSQAHRVVKDLLNREIAKPLTMDGRKRLSKWLNEAHYLNDMERCELLELVNKTTILKSIFKQKTVLTCLERKRCKQEMYGTWWSKVDARFEVGSSKFRFYTEYEPYGFGWGQVRWDIARKGTPRVCTAKTLRRFLIIFSGAQLAVLKRQRNPTTLHFPTKQRSLG